MLSLLCQSLTNCSYNHAVLSSLGSSRKISVYRRRLVIHCLVSILLLVSLSLSASAQDQLSPEIREKIDKLATDVLARTGVPSASVAIVKDRQIVYVKAYGDARLDPLTPATPGRRYSIGSIRKQVTAAAILLLKEQGKLSLDDKVAKFLPNLNPAREVTIRQCLSPTSD